MTNLKTHRVISMFAMLLMMAVLRTHAQEPVPQFRVAQEETRTNPDFIKRLADPEVNPELARKIPDPTTRLKAAQAVADQSCQTMNTIVNAVSNAQGCFIDITYSHTYTYATGSTNAFTLPHGLYVQVCQQILSVSVISGAWLSGVAPVISGNSVYWVKSCPGTSNYSNRIPSGQPLTVRLKLVNGFCPGSSCSVIIRELNGWAFPNNTSSWNCVNSSTINTLPGMANIGPDISVCTGNALNFNVISPSPLPAGTTVKWYKYTPQPCTVDCLPAPPCPVPLTSSWVLDLTGGGSYNTNILTQTTCYVAVIEYGCKVWISNVKRVNVCQGPPSATITATGPTTTLINGVAHACTTWSGELCLNTSTSSCCKTNISHWEWRTRSLSYSSPCNPVWGNWSSWTTNSQSTGENCIDIGPLQSAACQKQYEFRAILSNLCGQSTPTYTIVIDNPPVPGTITANPLPVLCFDKATKLTYSTTCAEVVVWEMREEVTPCSNIYGPWTIVSGSQGSCIWWTNNLQKTTQYKVKVKNGACLPAYTQPYIVRVKPKLEVTISANQTVLCPPGVTLTAQTTYGLPCVYPVTYQWFRDGLPIPGAILPTHNPTTGGNYYMVVKDICGNAQSNVITVCGKPQLVIEAPCCVCNGETITLQALVLWNPGNCPQSCTYQWNTGANTSSISVTSPGTYTVTVTCGACPPLAQSVTIKSCL